MIVLLKETKWNPFKMFHMADYNGDGKLLRTELKAWLPTDYHKYVDDVYNKNFIPRWRTDRYSDYFTEVEAIDIMFTGLDGNGDNSLTKYEVE